MDEEHSGERLLFGYFFLAAEEKVTGSKGFESKTIRTMARSVFFDPKALRFTFFIPINDDIDSVLSN
ncbi:MAG: hypothetical protein ACJASL_000463 [Paraglaciecola sp.]